MGYTNFGNTGEVIRKRLRQIISNLTENLGIEIFAQEPAEDHLHVLFYRSLNM